MMAVRRLLLGGVGLFVLLGLTWIGNPNDDTSTVATSRDGAGPVLCEQAASHLRQCCSRLAAPSIACTVRIEHHVPGWPGSSTSSRVREPVLSVDESRGILGASCDDLEALGACAEHAPAVLATP
jgi:hypothetical protein